MQPDYSRVAPSEDVSDTQDELRENLVGPSGTMPKATATTMIQVVAPATLPEGYEFDAAVGNNTIKVKVPPGGVEAGQKVSWRNSLFMSVSSFKSSLVLLSLYCMLCFNFFKTKLTFCLFIKLSLKSQCQCTLNR
jgi:hypothetical protein